MKETNDINTYYLLTSSIYWAHNLFMMILGPKGTGPQSNTNGNLLQLPSSLYSLFHIIVCSHRPSVLTIVPTSCVEGLGTVFGPRKTMGKACCPVMIVRAVAREERAKCRLENMGLGQNFTYHARVSYFFLHH